MIDQLKRVSPAYFAVSANRRVVPAARRGGHHATVGGNCEGSCEAAFELANHRSTGASPVVAFTV